MLRDGVMTPLKYQLNLRRPLVPVLAGVDCVPSYFIVGGLVFVPLSIPFLEHAYGGAQRAHGAPRLALLSPAACCLLHSGLIAMCKLLDKSFK